MAGVETLARGPCRRPPAAEVRARAPRPPVLCGARHAHPPADPAASVLAVHRALPRVGCYCSSLTFVNPPLLVCSTLKLAYKNLGDAGVCRLAELLRGPLKEVSVLDLSCTSIGSAGASALAAVLEDNTALRALDLSSNAATDVGAVALARALGGNTTLESLSLHACLIGDKGATALSSALQRNASLLELNLRQNYIGDAGAKALAAVIAAPVTKLRVCDLQNNSYAAAGKRALMEAYRCAHGRVESAMPLSWHAGTHMSDRVCVCVCVCESMCESVCECRNTLINMKTCIDKYVFTGSSLGASSGAGGGGLGRGGGSEPEATAATGGKLTQVR